MTESRMLKDLDVRVRNRNLKAGVIRQKDVDKYFAGLSDVAKNSEPLTLRQPGFEQEDEGEVDESGEMDAVESSDATYESEDEE